MRVGFLVNSVSRKAGGLFQSVRGLAKAVASTNADVRVFGICDEQSAVDLQEWQPLSVQTFRPRLRAWGYSTHLVPAMLDADLDILSVHGLWKYCSVGSHRWHQQTGRPYVVHPHGMLEPWAVRNAMWKKRVAALLYENQHLRGAACLRALSEAEAQSIRSYGLRNPICVIPNGVDLPDLRESNAKTQSANRKTLLYLGRLHPKKNISNLIRAWNETFKSQRGSADDWVLAIAGWDQGGYESELKRIAANTSVVFLGPKFGAGKSECYHACDAFILPSLSEGLPMAVLEAWAHAKPVLMTLACNLPEGFEANAALRIGTTPEEIAAGLKVLREMGDNDRSQMGNRGRALVATRFSWPRIGEQMCSVYESMVGGGSPPDSMIVRTSRMILSFGDKQTEDLWIDEKSKRYGNIARVALRKLLQLNAAEKLGDLSVPPGNQLKALSGKRTSQHSIRINDHWRICFVWTANGPEKVTVCDYH